MVYVAEQTEPVRRRVALKVIKLGMDTKQVVARFQAERQALAMMDHPNIAILNDGPLPRVAEWALCPTLAAWYRIDFYLAAIFEFRDLRGILENQLAIGGSPRTWFFRTGDGSRPRDTKAVYKSGPIRVSSRKYLITKPAWRNWQTR